MTAVPSISSRLVAIVGRPNVGKSSIFNRLVRRRAAIVHEARGVTRDRLVRWAEWDGRRFELVDTGGLGSLGPEGVEPAALDREIEDAVRRQAGVAIEDAAVIVFVTDLTAGVIPQDEEVAYALRKSGRPVFMAANKADTAARDAGAAEFDRLGFPVFPVSALHGRGFGELMAAVLERLPPPRAETAADALKVAVAGRPNVGKSSLINRLLAGERVIVSAQPGTTRDSIDIPFVIGAGVQARHYVLTDTAGIRRKGKIDSVVERFSLMRAEASVARADVVVLVLDAAAGPTAQDKTIAQMILDHRKGCVLAVNKWDLSAERSPHAYHAAMRKAVPFLAFAPVAFVSALNGTRVDSVVAAIDRVAAQTRAVLPTGLLNRVLIDAAERVQPPLVRGKRLKIFYATQIGVKPLCVALFVNDPERQVPAYEAYLTRMMRSKFGLEGAPLVFQYRRRSGAREQTAER